ncbi:MAG TPA: hypothetical protein VIH17_13030 [Candidatus Acidoferrales bacterium]
MKWLVMIPAALCGLGVALFVGCVVAFALGVAALATLAAIGAVLLVLAVKLLFPAVLVLLAVFLLARLFRR